MAKRTPDPDDLTGPSTHSERLKVEYDGVMIALHREMKRFHTPGIHSGLPEIAVLLDRNAETLAHQFNPTDYEHAPTLHCFLQVVETLKSRQAVEAIANLADCTTIPRKAGGRARTTAAVATDLIERTAHVAQALIGEQGATLLNGGKLSQADRLELRDKLFDLVESTAALIHKL